MIKYNHLSSSTAKPRYSIPKTKRFFSIATSYCSSAFYDLPSGFGKRAAGIGRGTKSNFCMNTHDYPGPDKYEKINKFDIALKKKKGKTMGISRNALPQPKDSKYPGPANYKIPNKMSRTKYTMRSRTVNKYEQRRQRNTPGPGAYQLPGLNRTGVYFHSKLRNSKVRSIGKVKRQSMNLRTCAPGPGQYNIEFKHLVRMSRVRNHTGTSFGKMNRNQYQIASRKAMNFPGPGNYEYLSDFPIRIKGMGMSKTRSRMSKTSRQSLPQIDKKETKEKVKEEVKEIKGNQTTRD